MYKENVLPNQKNGIYGHGRERYDAVLNVFAEAEEYTDETVWTALQAAAQDPNPQDITGNTQWSISYSNTNLTAAVVIRRHWEDTTFYSLTDNTVTR